MVKCVFPLAAALASTDSSPSADWWGKICLPWAINYRCGVATSFRWQLTANLAFLLCIPDQSMPCQRSTTTRVRETKQLLKFLFWRISTDSNEARIQNRRGRGGNNPRTATAALKSTSLCFRRLSCPDSCHALLWRAAVCVCVRMLGCGLWALHSYMRSHICSNKV